MLRRFSGKRAAWLLLLLACAGGCEKSATQQVTATAPAEEPTTAAAEGEHHGVHNLIHVAPGIISGSVPEGEAGFEELERLGVKTVVSVDGTEPDLKLAHEHGMRYVHLPVGYHGIDPSRQLELAKAVKELPGPVFMHCHHGVHRGPAAAASAAVLLGSLSNEEAVAFLKKAGTSPNYPGLYACVTAAKAASAEALASAPAEFPEVAPVPGFVHAMASAQEAYDHLVEIRDAGWKTPADHPDLVPRAEAQRLHEFMKTLRDPPHLDAARQGEFDKLLEASQARARELHEAVGGGSSTAGDLSDRLKAVSTSCKACHAVFRDVR